VALVAIGQFCIGDSDGRDFRQDVNLIAAALTLDSSFQLICAAQATGLTGAVLALVMLVGDLGRLHVDCKPIT